MVIDLIMAFIATAAFTIVFNAPKSIILYSGFVGTAGWFVYLIFQNFTDSPVVAVFFASLVIASISRNFAVRKKMPITVFLIAGMLPLVPGAGIYNTMYEIINKSPNASAKAVETFEIAGVIAIGIMIALSLPAFLFRGFKRK